MKNCPWPPSLSPKKRKKKKEDEEADIKWGKMKVQRKINERAMTRLVGGEVCVKLILSMVP